MKNKKLFIFLILGAFLFAGCNGAKQPSFSSNSNDSSESSESSSESESSVSESESSSSSSEQIQASFEVDSNISDAIPIVVYQDEYYYIGETVRFKIGNTQYNIDSVKANNVELTKETGEYPYSFEALEYNTIYITLSMQYASNPKTINFEFGPGVDQKKEQIYNFYTENSGVSYDVATTSKNYDITYKLSIDTDLIDDDGNYVPGLGYGDNDEIQINFPLYFCKYNGSSFANSYGFNMRMWKYKDSWLYRPLHGVDTASKYWSGTNVFDDHKNDEIARNIVKGLSRGGVEFKYLFRENTVTATAKIGDEVLNIGTCTSLGQYNGNDGVQLRYGDFLGQFSTNLSNTIKLTAANFIVDYSPSYQN